MEASRLEQIITSLRIITEEDLKRVQMESKEAVTSGHLRIIRERLDVLMYELNKMVEAMKEKQERTRESLTKIDISGWEPMLLKAGTLKVMVLVEDKKKFHEYLKWLQLMAKEIVITEKTVTLEK